MSKYDFERQLRDLLGRKPFEPFVIIVDDGRNIFVDEPAVAFNAGRAGFIPHEGPVEFFDCENVLGFRSGSQETAQ
jgi:hypothetical protein